MSKQALRVLETAGSFRKVRVGAEWTPPVRPRFFPHDSRVAANKNELTWPLVVARRALIPIHERMRAPQGTEDKRRGKTQDAAGLDAEIVQLLHDEDNRE